MKAETVSHCRTLERLWRHATFRVGSTEEKTLPKVDVHEVGYRNIRNEIYNRADHSVPRTPLNGKLILGVLSTKRLPKRVVKQKTLILR